MKPMLSRDFVVAHPLLTRLLWAGLTIPVTMLLMPLAGVTYAHAGPVPIVALLLVGAPLFGYLLRTMILWRDRGAR